MKSRFKCVARPGARQVRSPITEPPKTTVFKARRLPNLRHPGTSVTVLGSLALRTGRQLVTVISAALAFDGCWTGTGFGAEPLPGSSPVGAEGVAQSCLRGLGNSRALHGSQLARVVT
jgi:hypothetical protein